MNARFDLDAGLEKLRAILNDFPADSAHWNEAQNRFQFIDRLLLECLGWEHPFIEVEHSDEAGGKSDYILGTPPKAVLEAKKQAVIFDILPGTKPTSVRKLRPLITGCKKLEAAVVQVVQYCALSAAQIAIVCNGPQLVVFQTKMPDASPLDSECYVFNGFSDYVSCFPLLWKLLSPEGIAENVALKEISRHRNPHIPPKASTSLQEPQKYRYRSQFQGSLRTLADLLLDDVENNSAVKSEFYRECYVSLEANNQNLLLSKNIITQRYARTNEGGVTPASLSANLRKGKVDLTDGLQAGPMSAKPIVVIGDVGVGKTSFFENLFEKIERENSKLSIFIHINLGEKGTHRR